MTSVMWKFQCDGMISNQTSWKEVKKRKPTVDVAAANKVPSEGHVSSFATVSHRTKIYISYEY